MANTKNKGSVFTIVQTKPDASADDEMNKIQAAVALLIQSIIEGGDSVRRT